MFMLVSVCERAIDMPRFFATYEEAYNTMKEEVIAASRYTDGTETMEELKEIMETWNDFYLGKYSAYTENLNHDNCDWHIFEVDKEKLSQ